MADPRYFDGDPYEVAERAVKQAAAVARILSDCLEGAELMARNAEMERNLVDSDDPKASEWETSPQGERFKSMAGQVTDMRNTLNILQRAVAFNPKKAR